MTTDMAPSARQNWLESSIARESTQWVLWIPVAIGVGAALFFAAPHQPPLWLGAAVFSPLAWLTLWFRKSPWLRTLGLAFLLICLGFMAAQFRDWRTAHDTLARGQGPLWLQGTIADLDHKEKNVRLTLHDLTFEEQPRYPFNLPSIIRISVRGDVPPGWQAGDRIRALTRLMPLTAPTLPGGYDFAILQYYNGLGATGFTFGMPERIANAPESRNDWTENARQFVRGRIEAALPGQQAEAAIGTAIFTGEQNEIPKQESDWLRDSGLYHIISISGLHISYVAALIFFFVRGGLAWVPGLAIHWPLKKIAALVALAGIVAYTLFAGAPSPAQRACLMAGMALMAMMIDRHALSLRTIAVAAAVIIVLEPEQLYSVSFQLSFAAVTGLIAAFELFHPRMQKIFLDKPWWVRVWRAPAELMLTSLIATLSTMPFVFYHFQSTQIYGVLANMIGVPLTGLWVMPLGCLAFLLMPFGLDDFAFHWMGQGVSVLLSIARGVSELPGAVWQMPALPPLALGLFAIGFCWICIWQTRWRLMGLILIAAGFLTWPLIQRPDVMVSPGGKVMALRLPGGNYIFQGNARESFYRDSWAQWFGIKEESIDLEKDQPELNCDDDKCLITRAAQTLALIRSEDGFLAACQAGAKVLLSIKPIKGFRGECPNARVIKYWDTVDYGTHAFYFENGRWRMETVNDQRGHRPWVNTPQKKDMENLPVPSL